MIVGIEEAKILASEMQEGISDIVSAFLFLNRRTMTVIIQKFEEIAEMIPYKDSEIIYCGKLTPGDSAQEIFEQIVEMNERYEAMREE